MPRRVVVTGAAGRIGRVVVAELAARWDLLATDIAAADGVFPLDVTDPAACRDAFTGADAVVHLAANPDPDAGWTDLHEPNVVGAYTVVSAAVAVGVRRLVLASSLHAVSGTSPDVQARAGDPPRPGNLYGATKAWAEALGAWVAETTESSVVALRIGYFAPDRPDPATVSPSERSAWLSPRDAAELVRAAVEAELDGFVVVGGISANCYPKVDVSATAALIGYRPVDDAWA